MMQKFAEDDKLGFLFIYKNKNIKKIKNDKNYVVKYQGWYQLWLLFLIKI